MHSERPIPQMETERRAMTLLRLLVETYLKGGGGDDWKFCLLSASILSDIAINNATDGESKLSRTRFIYVYLILLTIPFRHASAACIIRRVWSR